MRKRFHLKNNLAARPRETLFKIHFILDHLGPLLGSENQSFSDKMSQAAYQKFLNNYEYEVSMGKFIDMYKAISMKS